MLKRTHPEQDGGAPVIRDDFGSHLILFLKPSIPSGNFEHVIVNVSLILSFSPMVSPFQA
jgi:hypothetical protein